MRGLAWTVVVRVLLADLIVVIPLVCCHTVLKGYVPKGMLYV